MRARTKLSMLILTNILMNLVTTSSLALVIAAAGQPSSQQQAKHRHKESAIAKLFNYDNYKASFGKSYSSDIENSNRRCYFYARALAVFVFAVNYKYRRIDYYKSLNFMSDWSRDQRAGMMGNGQAHGMMTRNRARLEAQRGGQLLAFTPAIGEKPEETLRNVLKLHARHNPRYRDLLNQLDLLDENKVASYSKRRSNRRQKRDVVTRQRRPRDFSFEELIESPRRKSNRVQNKARDETRAAEPQIVDNEDDEDRTENELMTQNNLPEPSVTTTTTTTTVTGDLSDQLESVSLSMLDLSGIESDSLARQMKSALSFVERDSSDGDGDEGDDGDRYDAEQEDTIFFDHRDSGCLSGVRQQGTCGSCYAFASIAIAEWLYCKEKGQLMEFSEQYMVDCAGNWIEDMYGCNGARDEKVVEFIHNFGLELRANYLYKGRETGCPYNASTNLSTTGYIRMQLSLLRIPPAMWAIIVEQAPLYVLVQMDDTFLDYGGGVDDGSRCVELDEIFEQPDKYSFHAMVIVGHGRQDGQEYWLIRNSHGRRWGELGYYKLSKDAPDGCVPYREAFAYGTKNGFDYEVGASENPQYNRTVVEEAKSVFKSSRENQQKGGARRRGRRGKRN